MARASATSRVLSEQGTEKENLLYGLMDFLLPRKYLITTDQGWNDWDLEISRGIWSKAQVRLGQKIIVG
jgi:hypothetical protein